MITSAAAFGALPVGLRDSLLAEYRAIVQNYLERRWTPASLGGGKFCEIVYTIIDGYGLGTYAAKPAKPNNMVQACKALENRPHVPRSFQILIPRLLPALYEVRNNRGVGHVGGDVDSNHMDSAAVLAIAGWIMCELVRVLHSMSTKDAQQVVDALATRRIPLVWDGANGMRRVLDPKVQLKDQVLLLLGEGTEIGVTDLIAWTGATNKAYFKKLLRELADTRMIELAADESTATILPPGSVRIEGVIQSHELKFPT
ncbi:hypothetical protein [Polaromonas sp. A23]|uniref:hypothetical protein n=1 Tax=Polaromonas sp. A23 TaxID=1944133 RepID=UPI0009D56BF3|nr:hypothetical protein [Polaromonas sp. A23]OOG43033.1 hypothetical protein B0B52_10345 [Polaromonas sp. A23]